MKLPRNISGKDLIRALKKLEYIQTRQSGSHIRLTRQTEKEAHHLTVPEHKPLKIGTLHSILTRVTNQTGITMEDLYKLLS